MHEFTKNDIAMLIATGKNKDSVYKAVQELKEVQAYRISRKEKLAVFEGFIGENAIIA